MPKNMNFCVIAYTFYESDYRVRRYAEALAQSGNAVDVIALRNNDKNKRYLLNEVNVYGIRKRNFDEKGPFSYLFKILLFFIKGSILLTFRHLWKRYRVIHIHNVPDFLVFMGLIPKLLGAKIILDIHDILPEFFCQKFDKPIEGILAKSLLIIEKLSVHFADHVIVANDIWREKIISRDKIIPERCTTYLNYPNLEFFSGLTRKAKRHDLRIIYPGHLSHHHGVDIGIKALALVKEEVPSVRFDIYPSSWILQYRNLLEDLIDSLNLSENVRFLEPVKIEELAKIYANVDLGIVTKREGVFSSEAFSTKIFDYMAAGIPIIASKTKIDDYYFDDTMIVFFKPEDHEDLARCIIELYKNPKKGESLVNNAKRFVAENNWEDKKEAYLNLVDSLVASKQHNKPSPR